MSCNCQVDLAPSDDALEPISCRLPDKSDPTPSPDLSVGGWAPMQDNSPFDGFAAPPEAPPPRETALDGGVSLPRDGMTQQDPFQGLVVPRSSEANRGGTPVFPSFPDLSDAWERTDRRGLPVGPQVGDPFQGLVVPRDSETVSPQVQDYQGGVPRERFEGVKPGSPEFCAINPESELCPHAVGGEGGATGGVGKLPGETVNVGPKPGSEEFCKQFPTSELCPQGGPTGFEPPIIAPGTEPQGGKVPGTSTAPALCSPEWLALHPGDAELCPGSAVVPDRIDTTGNDTGGTVDSSMLSSVGKTAGSGLPWADPHADPFANITAGSGLPWADNNANPFADLRSIVRVTPSGDPPSATSATPAAQGSQPAAPVRLADGTTIPGEVFAQLSQTAKDELLRRPNAVRDYGAVILQAADRVVNLIGQNQRDSLARLTQEQVGSAAYYAHQQEMYRLETQRQQGVTGTAVNAMPPAPQTTTATPPPPAPQTLDRWWAAQGTVTKAAVVGVPVLAVGAILYSRKGSRRDNPRKRRGGRR